MADHRPTTTPATASSDASDLDNGADDAPLYDGPSFEELGVPAALAQVLADAGVPPIVRDEFEERAFPDDVYGLAPASFADLDPALREPGLVWGAAKAHVVLARRRAEGLR